MTQAMIITPQFKEWERLRERAQHDEASALEHARQLERAKWESVVADKDLALADKDLTLTNALSELAALRAMYGETKE